MKKPKIGDRVKVMERSQKRGKGTVTDILPQNVRFPYRVLLDSETRGATEQFARECLRVIREPQTITQIDDALLSPSMKHLVSWHEEHGNVAPPERRDAQGRTVAERHGIAAKTVSGERLDTHTKAIVEIQRRLAWLETYVGKVGR